MQAASRVLPKVKVCRLMLCCPLLSAFAWVRPIFLGERIFSS